MNKRQEVREKENRVQVSRTTGTEKWVYKKPWPIQSSLECSGRGTVLGPTSGARIKQGPNEMVPDMPRSDSVADGKPSEKEEFKER